MSMLGILDRITAKKKANVLSVGEAYYQLVRSVASGEETDIDQAADIIEAASKTEENFQADVETMEKRFKLAEQLDERRKTEATIPKLKREAEAAKKQLNDAIENLRPVVNQTAIRLREAENRVLQFSDFEKRLQDSCLNPTLISREQELEANRVELMRQRSPLDQDLRRAREMLRSWQNQVENYEQSLARNKNWLPTIGADKSGLSNAKDEVREHESTVAQLQAAVDAINDELRPINVEIFDIRQKKLLP